MVTRLNHLKLLQQDKATCTRIGAINSRLSDSPGFRSPRDWANRSWLLTIACIVQAPTPRSQMQDHDRLNATPAACYYEREGDATHAIKKDLEVAQAHVLGQANFIPKHKEWPCHRVETLVIRSDHAVVLRSSLVVCRSCRRVSSQSMLRSLSLLSVRRSWWSWASSQVSTSIDLTKGVAQSPLASLQCSDWRLASALPLTNDLSTHNRNDHIPSILAISHQSRWASLDRPCGSASANFSPIAFRDDPRSRTPSGLCLRRFC